MIDKQQTGFKFGKYHTTLLRSCGEVWGVDGRKYKLVLLRTSDGHDYYAIRLYNGSGKFIKQLLFEPSIIASLVGMLIREVEM